MRGNSKTNLDSNRSMRSSDCNCIKNDNGYSCSITNDDSTGRFFFKDPANTKIYTLTLHDALTIFMFDNGSIECINVRSNTTGMRGNSNTNLDSNRSMRSSDCNCIKNDNGYSCSITNDDSTGRYNG